MHSDTLHLPSFPTPLSVLLFSSSFLLPSLSLSSPVYFSCSLPPIGLSWSLYLSLRLSPRSLSPSVSPRSLLFSLCLTLPLCISYCGSVSFGHSDPFSPTVLRFPPSFTHLVPTDRGFGPPCGTVDGGRGGSEEVDWSPPSTHPFLCRRSRSTFTRVLIRRPGNRTGRGWG